MPTVPFSNFAEAEDVINRAVVAEAADLLRALIDLISRGKLTPGLLGEIVNLSYLAEEFVSDSRHAAHMEAKAGRPPMGFRLVVQKGERAWTNRAAVLDILRRQRGARLSDIAVPITPAQAEQRFGPRVYAKLGAFVALKPGAARLVRSKA